MNKISKLYFVILIIVIPIPLYAYLDPGTGSMLFSAFIGIIGTVFFLAKGLFSKIVNLPSFIRGKTQNRGSSYDIVFYSEGAQYWPVFKPVIEQLEKRGIEAHYFTSGDNDPALKMNYKYIKSRHIGKGNKAYFVMNTLEADVVVMTTPGLDVLQLKRSRGVKHYCHITHSAAGCSGYSTYGLDYYDSVLVGGIEDKQVIEELESKRNIRKKKVEVIGCSYLDTYRDKLEHIKKNGGPEFFRNDLKTVLISPTWGETSLLYKHGEELIKTLINSGKYNIIVRPHPQSFISDTRLINRLSDKFPDNDRLVWNRDSENLPVLRQSDIMVSDFSGIIFDYVFLFERPVLTFAGAYDKRCKDDMDCAREPWVLTVLEDIGRTLRPEDVSNICPIIDATIESDVLNTAKIRKFRSDMDAFPGEAGQRAADILIEIKKSVK